MNLSSSKLPFSFVILLAALLVRAQGADLPDLPGGKIPVDLPKYAAWEVAYEYKDLPSTDSPQVSKPPAESSQRARPKLTTVTRTDDLIREKTVWTDGSTTESWTYRELLELIQADAEGNPAKNPPEKYDPDFIDYRKGDFPKFSWVAPKWYAEYKNIEGRDCYVFRIPSTELPPDRPEVIERYQLPPQMKPASEQARLVSAVVDAKTLHPVSIDDGKVKRGYRILPPPATPLQIPAAFAEMLDEWVKEINEAQRKPTPP